MSDRDVEEKCAEIKRLRREIERIEEEIKQLSEEVLPELESPRYFIDEDGKKLYAHRVTPTSVVVDLEALEAEVPEIVSEVVVVTRKVDPKLFARAVATGKIDKWTARRVASEVERKPYVRFGDPEKA